MRCFLSVLMFASLMMLSSAPTYSASGFVLDEATGLWASDTVVVGRSVTFTFRLTNTDGSRIAAFTNGFRMWTQREDAYTDNYEPITYDTLPLVWRVRFDLVFGIYPHSVDGLGADTVGIGGASLLSLFGIPDGFDQQVWWLGTTPSADGDTLCVDSSWFPPGGEWLWHTVPAGNIHPHWPGPYCFVVWECCVGIRGNVDGLAGIGIADLIFLVEHLFCGGPAPRCEKEGDVDADGRISSVADLIYLVDYLFFDGPAPAPCP